MADSIFKQIGSVMSAALNDAVTTMNQMVTEKLDTEVVVMNQNIDQTMKKLQTDELHRMLKTRVL